MLALHPLCFDANPRSGSDLGEMANDGAQSLDDFSSFQTYRGVGYIVVIRGEVRGKTDYIAMEKPL